MSLLKSFFLGEEDPPRAEAPPIPAKVPAAKPPGGQFTDEDRKKALEARRTKSASQEEVHEVRNIKVQREVVRLLKELQKTGITINALVTLVADGWHRVRRGAPINWRTKKQIVAEIFEATQQVTKHLTIKEGV